MDKKLLALLGIGAIGATVFMLSRSSESSNLPGLTTGAGVESKKEEYIETPVSQPINYNISFPEQPISFNMPVLETPWWVTGTIEPGTTTTKKQSSSKATAPYRPSTTLEESKKTASEMKKDPLAKLVFGWS